jgi:hypothetical protein
LFSTFPSFRQTALERFACTSHPVEAEHQSGTTRRFRTFDVSQFLNLAVQPLRILDER